MYSIAVLMSTYNGEKHLRSQLESLLSQSFRDWRLYVRDDGSRDDTRKILEEYASVFGDRMSRSPDGQNLGAAQSFMLLLEGVEENYVMFCDQDDIWKVSKIQDTYVKMKEAESEMAPDTPILVHTDLELVTEDLSYIDSSMFRYQHIDSKASQKTEIMVQNIVTGCTMMINKSLREIAVKTSGPIIMHDWLCALVAAFFGRIVFLDSPTIFYRQHNSNTIGAKNWSAGYVVKRLLYKRKEIVESIRATQRQAETFLISFAPILAKKDKKILFDYAYIDASPYPLRVATLSRYSIRKNGIIRTIGLYLNI